MIVVDTNVVSEPMRRAGNQAVQDWLDRQAPETLYLTTTSLSELMLGIEVLPDGKRKKGLATALGELLARLFGSRILSFDPAAAVAYAQLVGRARSQGTPISVADGQVAAIARTRGFSVATRDVRPFTAAGLATINPWND